MRVMRTSLVGAVLFTAAIGLFAQGREADHYLDIPGQGRTPIPSGSFFPGPNSIGGSSHPSVSNPLRLTLRSIDGADFAYGDYFNFEVLIENTGKQPIRIPWSPNAGAFAQPVRRTPSEFLNGGLSLQVESADGKQALLAFLDSQALYGSAEVPGSLLMLAPGRIAHVRVPAQWSATVDAGRDAILRQPGGAVQVRAVFSIFVDSFPSARSTNTIPVRVVRRELR